MLVRRFSGGMSSTVALAKSMFTAGSVPSSAMVPLKNR